MFFIILFLIIFFFISLYLLEKLYKKDKIVNTIFKIKLYLLRICYLIFCLIFFFINMELIESFTEVANKKHIDSILIFAMPTFDNWTYDQKEKTRSMAYKNPQGVIRMLTDKSQEFANKSADDKLQIVNDAINKDKRISLALDLNYYLRPVIQISFMLLFIIIGWRFAPFISVVIGGLLGYYLSSKLFDLLISSVFNVTTRYGNLFDYIS